MATEIKIKTTMTIGHIDVVIDPDNWDWHIDCHPGYTEAEVPTVVAVCVGLGMEFYEDEECEPDVLEDGTVRYWMSPKEAVPE